MSPPLLKLELKVLFYFDLSTDALQSYWSWVRVVHTLGQHGMQLSKWVWGQLEAFWWWPCWGMLLEFSVWTPGITPQPSQDAVGTSRPKTSPTTGKLKAFMKRFCTFKEKTPNLTLHKMWECTCWLQASRPSFLSRVAFQSIAQSASHITIWEGGEFF